MTAGNWSVPETEVMDVIVEAIDGQQAVLATAVAVTVLDCTEVVIFGSGHDVASVAELATRVNFRVSVTTVRGAVADAERFPAADRVCSTSPADVQDTLSSEADMILLERVPAAVVTGNPAGTPITGDERRNRNQPDGISTVGAK